MLIGLYWARMHAAGFESTMWWNLVGMLDWLPWALGPAGPLARASSIEQTIEQIPDTHPEDMWVRLKKLVTVTQVL